MSDPSELRRRVTFLEGERKRLEWLLAHALEVAVGGTNTTPIALLEVLVAAMPPRQLDVCEAVAHERALAVLMETA